MIPPQFIELGLAEGYDPIYKFPSVVGRPKDNQKIGESIEGVEVKVSNNFYRQPYHYFCHNKFNNFYFRT